MSELRTRRDSLTPGESVLEMGEFKLERLLHVPTELDRGRVAYTYGLDELGPNLTHSVFALRWSPLPQ